MCIEKIYAYAVRKKQNVRQYKKAIICSKKILT